MPRGPPDKAMKIKAQVEKTHKTSVPLPQPLARKAIVARNRAFKKPIPTAITWTIPDCIKGLRDDLFG